MYTWLSRLINATQPDCLKQSGCVDRSSSSIYHVYSPSTTHKLITTSVKQISGPRAIDRVAPESKWLHCSVRTVWYQQTLKWPEHSQPFHGNTQETQYTAAFGSHSEAALQRGLIITRLFFVAELSLGILIPNPVISESMLYQGTT